MDPTHPWCYHRPTLGNWFQVCCFADVKLHKLCHDAWLDHVKSGGSDGSEIHTCMCADVAGLMRTKEVSGIDFVCHGGIAGKSKAAVSAIMGQWIRIIMRKRQHPLLTVCAWVAAKSSREMRCFALSTVSAKEGLHWRWKWWFRDGVVGGQETRCNNLEDKLELQWWLARTLYNYREGWGERH